MHLLCVFDTGLLQRRYNIIVFKFLYIYEHHRGKEAKKEKRKKEEREERKTERKIDR